MAGAASARKGGARPKVVGGMTHVVYLRMGEELNGRIEEARVQRSRDAGVALSTADVVRALLTAALNASQPRRMQ